MSAEDNAAKNTIQGQSVEVVRQITLPSQRLHQDVGACEASFAISYAQMNDRITVDTEVENESCVASHGEFQLRIRTKSAAGEISTRSFSEAWSRTSEGNVQQTNDYPMAGATDLIWVMVDSNRKTACVCD